jgi:spermidine/putrescine transport system permease protein
VSASTRVRPRIGTADDGRSLARRMQDWFANPWGKPRFLALFTWLYLAWAIAPVLIAIQFSFNDGRSRSVWQGFSLRWYTSEPELSVVNDPALHDALFQSLRLASITMLIATPIGVALALGLTRWRGRGSRPANFLMLFPLVTPELVMGTALFLVFVHVYTMVTLGTTAQVLGHVTFSISYVVIIVRARLLSIGREYEEAAMDLGASPLQALRLTLLPLLFPAILASLLIVFAISIDDFVISQYLSGDASTQTMPVLIYSTARAAPNPALNALASIMVFTTLIAVALAFVGYRWFTRYDRRTRREGGAGFGGFDL